MSDEDARTTAFGLFNFAHSYWRSAAALQTLKVKATLGRLALRYTGHAGGNGGLAPDYTTLDAIDDCSKGNTARGILILEKKLRCSGFTLPKR